MATRVKPEAPRGRDEIIEASLDAAERLFATLGPRAVSLRDVAAEAGVTYSLVNRHLGSKEALHDRLLARYETRWRARMGQHASLPDAASALLGDQPDAGLYLRLLAWSLLGDREDDASVAAHRDHSLLHELIEPAEGLGLTTAEAEARVAALLALTFGWRFFGSFIVDALRVPADERPRIHASVSVLIDRLTRADGDVAGS